MEQGLGDYKYFLLDGKRVEAKLIKTKILRREDETSSFEELDKLAPKGANAFYMRRVERAKNAIFYTIEYYKA